MVAASSSSSSFGLPHQRRVAMTTGSAVVAPMVVLLCTLWQVFGAVESRGNAHRQFVSVFITLLREPAAEDVHFKGA